MGQNLTLLLGQYQRKLNSEIPLLKVEATSKLRNLGLLLRSFMERG